MRHLQGTTRALVGMIGLAVLAGCSSSSQALRTEADIARYFLPTTRVVAHPDSLDAVTFQPDTSRFAFQADRPYGELARAWSVAYESDQGGGLFTRRPFRSFATLVSRDLYLLNLDRELGLSTLSRDLGERLYEERIGLFEDYLVIRVHVFIDERYRDAFANTRLDAPGVYLRLMDGEGREYAPVRVESEVVQRAQQGADANALYRTNTLYFLRDTPEGDLLDADLLELMVRLTRPRPAQIRFTWEIDPEAEETAARSERTAQR